MMNNGSLLRAGQVIKYMPGLWRVEHVNESRARIVPLAKRTVVLADRVFEADRAGVNISARSCVELVTDIEHALDEIQLAEAEAEVSAARREATRAARAGEALAEAEAELAALRAETPGAAAVAAKPGAAVAAKPTAPVPAGGTAGWAIDATKTPGFKAGTMGDQVYRFIAAHPGLTTKVITETCGVTGAVAACVSRFHQAGLIVRG